jgi:hypothetical protein
VLPPAPLRGMHEDGLLLVLAEAQLAGHGTSRPPGPGIQWSTTAMNA